VPIYKTGERIRGTFTPQYKFHLQLSNGLPLAFFFIKIGT